MSEGVLNTSIESIEKHAKWLSPCFPRPPAPVSVYPVRLMIVAKRPGVAELMINEYAGTAVEQGDNVPLTEGKRAELIGNLASCIEADIEPGKLRGRINNSYEADEPRDWHDVEWVRFYELGDRV